MNEGQNDTLKVMAERFRQAAEELRVAYDIQDRVSLAMPLDVRSLVKHLRHVSALLSDGALSKATTLHRDFSVVGHAVWLAQAGHRKNPSRLRAIGQRGGKVKSAKKAAAVRANVMFARKRKRRAQQDAAEFLLSVMSAELLESGRSWTLDGLMAGKVAVRAAARIKWLLKHRHFPDVRDALEKAGGLEYSPDKKFTVGERSQIQKELLHGLRQIVGKNTKVWLKTISGGAEECHGPFSAPRYVDIPTDKLITAEVWFRREEDEDYSRLNLNFTRTVKVAPTVPPPTPANPETRSPSDDQKLLVVDQQPQSALSDTPPSPDPAPLTPESQPPPPAADRL